MPRPRINLILYYGVLGPRAAWRADVVRCQTSGDGGDLGLEDSATEQARDADPAETARRPAQPVRVPSGFAGVRAMSRRD